MTADLTQKPVMLITGTSRGIGRYLADYYVKSGFFVIGCSRTNADLDDDSYSHLSVDISNEEDVLEVFRYIRKDVKRLDVLVNNAAVNPSVLGTALLSYDTIMKAYKTNVFAPMLFCRESIKLMSRNKFGRIINIGSMVTKHEDFGGALYTSAKASINAFSRVLAKEVYRSGITVNVVAPSAIETDLSTQVNQKALKEVLSRNAVVEYGELADVSNIIDYLIGKESAAITGQVIYLGGV